MEQVMELSAAVRRAHLKEMAEQPLDVLVIGGGITGAGVALDAAARGYRVGLIERDDFASGTSGASTKLVHGGIRYLPQLDFPLVREALRERGRLLRNAPYLVHPLSFILPLYAHSRHPVGLPVAPPGGIGLGAILNTGLTLYDMLAGKENIGSHRRLSRQEVTARAPCLVPEGLKSGFIYYDARTDDTRLTLAVLRTAAAAGARLANYCQAVRFAHSSGRLVGVYARETLPGASEGESDEHMITARHIVNATGVWAERTERLAGDAARLQIQPSKGTHLVIARERLGLGDEAIVLPETEDGRIIFIVPWQSRALVGTTDHAVREIEDPVATEDEITYLLGHLNRYVRAPLSRDDIITTYSGNRPLLRLTTARTPARLSRTHAVVESADGLLTVSGGKLTTYRRMAQDVLDRIDHREGRAVCHPTLTLALVGAEGWAEARGTIAMRGRALGLDAAVIQHLGGAYGTEALGLLALVAGDARLGRRLVADLPYIGAEVVWAVRAELALTVGDVLARRTHVALEDRTRGASVAAEVAALMADELGWSREERTRQAMAYTAYARQQAGPLASRIPPPTDLTVIQPARPREASYRWRRPSSDEYR
ncbi:MAG: glycerol-3-phosphate dehydrogenase/oxidase [Ktedonobacterales bacterium]|nr:glycerol-3-phosphate dehydrogenase/oxidase [Ktedonobacterales bacterium]